MRVCEGGGDYTVPSDGQLAQMELVTMHQHSLSLPAPPSVMKTGNAREFFFLPCVTLTPLCSQKVAVVIMCVSNVYYPSRAIRCCDEYF